MRVLTDTGPLAAILSSTDQYHEVCRQTVQSLRGPRLSCWAVITEAAWLLQSTPGAFEKLLRSISDGIVETSCGREGSGRRCGDHEKVPESLPLVLPTPCSFTWRRAKTSERFSHWTAGTSPFTGPGAKGRCGSCRNKNAFFALRNGPTAGYWRVSFWDCCRVCFRGRATK